MELPLFFLGLAALLIVVLVLFALGWRGRRSRQQGTARPVPVPDNLGEPDYQAVGQYVATTTAGDWLDRVALYGLGVKSNATAAVFPSGLFLARSGAPDLWIPRKDLRDVRLERGMAGKFVEKEGLVVVTWLLGTKRLDTGFRTRTAADKTPLLNAITDLLPASDTPSEEQL